MDYKGKNLSYFVLTGIESELIETENPKTDYYLFKFPILDLETLEQHIITEKVLKMFVEQEIIEGNLMKILFENNFPDYMETYNYLVDPDKHFIDCDIIYDSATPINEIQCFFNGIKLKQHITRFEDILIIPNSIKQLIRVLNEQRINNDKN